MWIDYFTVCMGGLLIISLAYLIIKKTTDLAKHYGFSGTFVGMTLLSIGTSLPEIFTHVVGSIHILKEPATMNALSGLVIGTNIGSDIFQQNFILGFVAILSTLVILRKNAFSNIGGLIGGSLILLVVSLNGFISRLEGALLFVGYLGYLFYLNKKRRLNDQVKAKKHLTKKSILLNLFILLVSFGLMAFLADRVLESSRVIVNNLPISASFFGVLILGLVAALPELTTSLIALKKRRKGMSAGILIGSNITNPTFALGLGALISTYKVPGVVIWFDLPIKILGSLVILAFFWRDERIGKKEGIILIIMFIIYLVLRNLFFPTDF